MSEIRKILVPYDDNMKSIRALDYAAMFASGIGAGIEVLHLVDRKEIKSKSALDENIHDIVTLQLKPKLVDIQKKYPDIKKVNLQIRALEKTVGDHILDFAKTNNIDFIVMRGHGNPDHRDWEFHFKNTTAYKVVLESSCPVFTFTQTPEQPKIERILVPFDLNDGSLFKLPLVIEFAQKFNAELHLLSASEHNDDYEELERQLNEIYAEIRDKNIKVVRNNLMVETLPSAINLYTEKNDIDLVVIMSRPGFRWSDLWVSPRAKRILSEASVPVLSIRANQPLSLGI